MAQKRGDLFCHEVTCALPRPPLYSYHNIPDTTRTEGSRMARTTAQVDGATLILPGQEASPIIVDTPAWFTCLEQAITFTFSSPSGRFTARKERQTHGGGYWKAYRTSRASCIACTLARRRP